jgi:hypothetical protein
MTTSAKVRANKSGEPWRGIHVLVNNNEETDALAKEIPELEKIGVNVLVVEVDYNYAYVSHNELRGPTPITHDHIRVLAETCRAHGIRPIPQFQCLGHQSWAKTTHPLLVQYPQFDETPGQFPGNEGIYCRSWCPQHPKVNPIIFRLFDELIDAFEADALHVGMDEVFLIGSEYCPRCKGHDPSELFAKAINDYHAHLVNEHGVEMLMWGDRLLDGNITGYGKWEAAENGTNPAINLIQKDIVICDWHYTLREDYPSIPLFLEKGFRVWPSGWKEVEATKAFIDFSQRYKNERMLGYLCTTWGAVKMDQLAQWPPIRIAMGKLS